MEELASNKRIAKNTLYMYIRMVAIMLVSLYTSRLILDILGVSDFGVYTVIGGIVSIFSLLNGALSAGSSRFITYALGKGEPIALKKTFSASFSIHTAMAVVVFILAETIGLWYVNSVLVVPGGRLGAANWIYQFSIVSCMLSVTQVPYTAAIIAHERMTIYARVGLVEAIFKLTIVWILMFTDNVDNLILNGALLMTWSIGSQLYYRYYCIKHFAECKLVYVKEREYYKSMLSFSLWDIIGTACSSGYSQVLNLMMNFFFGVVVNAAKGIVTMVDTAIQQFSNGFMTAVNPQLVKLYANKKYVEMVKLINRSSKYAGILLCTLYIPVFIKADCLLELWLKEVPEYSGLFLRCMIMACVVRATAKPVVLAVHATGNIKNLNIYAGGTSLFLNLPVTLLLYKMGYPPQICFYVSLCVNIICSFIELLILRKQVALFSIKRYCREVYAVCFGVEFVSFLFVEFVNLHLDYQNFISLVIVSVASLFANGVLTYFIVADAETRHKINSFVKEKLNNI